MKASSLSHRRRMASYSARRNISSAAVFHTRDPLLMSVLFSFNGSLPFAVLARYAQDLTARSPCEAMGPASKTLFRATILFGLDTGPSLPPATPIWMQCFFVVLRSHRFSTPEAESACESGQPASAAGNAFTAHPGKRGPFCKFSFGHSFHSPSSISGNHSPLLAGHRLFCSTDRCKDHSSNQATGVVRAILQRTG